MSYGSKIAHEQESTAVVYRRSGAPETRLQTLRRLRSERLRERAEALTRFRVQMGWACLGCGCDLDGYSLDCPRCWERATKKSRWNGPLRAAAEAYLAERRLHAAEKNRALLAERNARNPWPKGRPDGSQGFWKRGSGME